MKGESEREDPKLSWTLTNFSSWYSTSARNAPAYWAPYFDDLRAVIDGFEDLQLAQVGETTRSLRLETRVEFSAVPLTWRELSEGQRAWWPVCLLHWAVGPTPP